MDVYECWCRQCCGAVCRLNSQKNGTVREEAVARLRFLDREVFDTQAAARDWEQIFAMFHRQIPPYAA